MIVISGITISNPSGNLNSVVVEILDSGSTVIETMIYSGQTIIEYSEPANGIYYVRITDGTSSVGCELTKTVYTNSVCFDYSIGTNNSVLVIIQDLNSKYLIGGYFTTYNSETANYIIRLKQDGSIDTSFNSGSGFDDNVNSLQQTTDGGYLVGGSFTSYSGQTANCIIKLKSDGSIDTSFNSGSGFDYQVNSLQQTTDGGYLVGGYFTSYSGQTANYIIKLKSDGSRDTSFNSGSGFNGVVDIVQQTTDGGYLVGGSFTSYSGQTANFIIKLKSDGSIDTSFNSGDGFDNSMYRIIQDSNDKYICIGSFTVYNNIIANHIIRLYQDGSIDNTFNSGTGFNGSLFSLIQDSNGKYIIGGQFTVYSGQTANRIIRLNQDGRVDNTFNSGSGFEYTINTIIQDSNSKYLIGGYLTTYNGAAVSNIIRLNTDGTPDIC